MRSILTYMGALTAMFFVTVSPSRGFSLNIDEFIKNASIRYEKAFTINAPLELWNRVLDNPVLVGKLWELYNFTPRYLITSKGAGVHIVDPSGIEGDMVEIHSDIYNRSFYASGKMHNWYIPVSLRGKALFLIKQTYENGKVYVTLSIYGERGDTVVTRMLLDAVSPVLTFYINRRVTRNLADLGKIIDDIVHKPEIIRPRISGQFLITFEQLVKTSG